MSGEAGGVIIGGIFALAVVPVAIAGAAAAGAAYGAVRVGGFLGRHALAYAQEKGREKQLVVNQCSTQLSALYSQMQAVVRDEASAHVEYAQRMSKRFTELGEQLKAVQAERPDAEVLDRQVRQSRRALKSEFEKQSQEVRNDILEKGKKRLAQCVSVIEKSCQERDSLVQWADASVEAVSMQKAAAQEMLRDAEASVRLLESMSQSSGRSAFKIPAGTMVQTLERARDMFDQKMYQGAFSNARTIIRGSAVLASEYVQEELEKDICEMELRVRLERLLEEMKAQRIIEFCDETRRDQKKVKADLNHFSQGKYKQIQSALEEQIAALEGNAYKWTLYDIQKRIEQFDFETEPEARRIIERSQRVMTGYYERLHVLEVVADFMSEQDYKMDWAMPVGGDVSQKLVVHFVQRLTGNTVSVTLENDVDSGDIANMAMEVLTFYGNGRTVTEDEKKELRCHLTETLNKAGLGGTLCCQGNVGEASSQVEMNQKESVKNMPVKSIV